MDEKFVKEHRFYVDNESESLGVNVVKLLFRSKKDGKDSSGSSSTVPAKKPKIAAAKKEAASATASSAEALLFSELNKLDEE